MYDGSGSPGVRQDVAVHGDRIVAVGDGANGPGVSTVVEADGLALAPGFIDMHSHADHTLPANPTATNSITQGVTTELIGLCGFSPAPVSVEPSKASQLGDMAAGIGPDLQWGWHSFGDFLDALATARPAVNVVPLVGHHALRILAMGVDTVVPGHGPVVDTGAVNDEREYLLWVEREAKGRFDAEKEQYLASLSNLRQLEASNPYPNAVNVQKMKTYLDTYRTTLNKLKTELTQHVLPMTPLLPNEFQMRLREAMTATTASARVHRV